MERIYFDNAATTPLAPEVLEAMTPFFADDFGNASSLHMEGQRVRKAVEDARYVVASCIGATPDEIYFTSGGTESDNAAIKGAVHAASKNARHVVTSAIEHHAVLDPCHFLEMEGCRVLFIPVDETGVVDLDALKNVIDDRTSVVSIMAVNNETGVIQPVDEIARIVHQRGSCFHTDAIQAIGHIPVDVNEFGADMLSISAHKLNGPKGVGALYVRKGVRFTPLLHGGHQERGRRAGTSNVAGIVGLAKAMETAVGGMRDFAAAQRALRDQLERGVRERIDGVHTNGHPDRRAPHILSMSFDGIEGESLLLTLDMRGVAVSTGSACTSGATEPSHVLRAMGFGHERAMAALRFSFGRYNTEEQVGRVIETLVEAVAALRGAVDF